MMMIGWLVVVGRLRYDPRFVCGEIDTSSEIEIMNNFWWYDHCNVGEMITTAPWFDDNRTKQSIQLLFVGWLALCDHHGYMGRYVMHHAIYLISSWGEWCTVDPSANIYISHTTYLISSSTAWCTCLACRSPNRFCPMGWAHSVNSKRDEQEKRKEMKGNQELDMWEWKRCE